MNMAAIVKHITQNNSKHPPNGTLAKVLSSDETYPIDLHRLL